MRDTSDTHPATFRNNGQSSAGFMKKTVAAILFGLVAIPAQAAVITWTGDIRISSNPVAGELDLGDTFSFQFDLDDSATDASASSTTGIFTNAVSNISILKTGGTGSWDPAGGSFASASFFTGTTSSVSHTAGFQLVASGLPTLGGNAFDRFIFGFGIPAGSSTINDTGAGQTLFDQLGALNNLSGFNSMSVTFNTNPASPPPPRGSISNLSPSPVPVPAAVWLMGSALLGLVGFRRKATS